MMPYSVAFTCFRKQIGIATEIRFDLSTNTLYFLACEAPVLICKYEHNVSGSVEQVKKYFAESFKTSFPDKVIRIYENI